MNRGDIQGGRHDDDDEIGPRRFLDLQSTRQRDVPVEMPFVKFVEYDRVDTFQVGISQHLAQQHAFGHVTNTRGRRGDIVQPHLIAHLATKFYLSSLRDPRREHSRRQAARLQDRHLAVAQQSAVEQHLWHLGRMARGNLT
ncbi:MAG TPA: hypothetical protein VGW77_23145 [Candidatus Binatia bacterium]|nr:hypothetical protein [Candidatus Binatia bacterium]